MKHYVDFTEQICLEDEENLEINEDEIYEMKRATKIKTKTAIRKNKNQMFNKNDFDSKVACVLVNIHRNLNSKSYMNSKRYMDWIEKNYEHLDNLHKLSDLTISQEDFFSFVYEHSQNSHQ